MNIEGLHYQDDILFTTKMVAEFYGVDERTIIQLILTERQALRYYKF